MEQQINITSRLRRTAQFIFDFGGGPSGRNAWVDYAKGIAIIFVVYRHVIFGLLYSGASINSMMMDANEMLYGFRMPLFFFLSGLFYAGSVKKRGSRNYLVSKVNTLLYPYLLWCVIQLTLQILFSDFTNAKHTFSSYINILIHPRTMLQLWYLFALFNVSVLYLATDRLLKLGPYGQILFGLILLALKPLAGDISTLSDVMMHYIYFCIGHLSAPFFFRESVQARLTSPRKLLLLLPVFLVVQYLCMIYADMNIFLYSTLAMFGGLIVIMLSFILAKADRLKFLRTLGSYSLYIFLLHISIVFLIRAGFVSTGIISNTPLATFLLVTCGIFFSIMLYRICLLLHLRFLFVGPLKETNKIVSPS